MSRSRLLPLMVSLGLLAVPAGGQLKMKIRPDGTKFFYNDRPAPASHPAGSGGDLADLVDHHAARSSLDPRLVHAVIQAESSYNPRALSRKGAQGLMQLMPATARQLRVADPYDPDDNLRGGTVYLRHLLDRFGGRLALALAAYNAGPEAVERAGGVPPFPETREYVRRVYRLYRGEEPTQGELRKTGGEVVVTRDRDNRLIMVNHPVALDRR